ncbi:hypothetical protein FRC0418_02045 [Corynebacterium diphtheriae]|uniref:DUF1707 SHOCT-like domain-containing protein n=1 Tax=Corynebacterium diphtheriae TaxID=1717 RepID=UPI0009E19E04|nr:DUF1707 domain-containing protein [Corynebacterium diphtheriae]MBG9336538.1 DUF1707 domain-containing protein [Corynebacterium diphtheriae bv. gravis]RLP13278.1 DUF1707 domain-containing protein [Corynebacterium diphtheriae]CAB0613492.1 hypothetical protein CIP107536_01807 [Corynebacterium diphtheriae]CAB0667349.1 hypothetical protein CIP107582_02156 [Corynebacterium diphtheriae]CAB0917059.1 hypothetical protein FRC0418_02045 [Corynebacterium diphtheriae]
MGAQAGILECMFDPYQPDYRIGDAERRQAMDDLGEHFAAGRLDLATYEQRLDVVTNATMMSELSELFDDLPANSAQAPSTTGTMAVYSAAEVSEAHRSGRNIRSGIMGLTSILCVMATSVTDEELYMFLIPIVAILLYVLKVGPKQWYAPSTRQLEKQRMRQISAAHQNQLLALQASQNQQRAIAKAERKRKQAELNSIAMDLATDTLKRFRDKSR